MAIARITSSYRPLGCTASSSTIASMDEADPGITVSTTSARTANISPIVLRTTQTSRLIFRPVLIDNRSNPDASIDGEFVYQKKGVKSEWEDFNQLPLSKLKADEWIRL
jgi:hypothetical protein